MSVHAREAARRRGVSVRRVLEVLVDPEVTYGCEAYGQGRWIFKRGPLALAVHPETKVVITVLWNISEVWTDASMRGAMVA